MGEFPSCLRSNLLPPIISTLFEIQLSRPMAAVMWMCGGGTLVGQCGFALKGRHCAPSTACQSSPIRVMLFHARLGHPWRPNWAFCRELCKDNSSQQLKIRQQCWNPSSGAGPMWGGTPALSHPQCQGVRGLLCAGGVLGCSPSALRIHPVNKWHPSSSEYFP